MEVKLPPGRYVIAVSGGVDSVALLHYLKDRLGVQLTVAHFDHGIREDSAEDRKLVQALAKKYGLPFVYHTGKLGSQASEAQARQARYGFLHHVRQASQAQAIITAHHQDDVLETIILNLLRGTGRRGLSSLKSTDTIKRPLLHIPKNELLRYAEREKLIWHEDSTNNDQKYMRNYIRKNLLPRFAESNREQLKAQSQKAARLNYQIEQAIHTYLHVQPSTTELDRQAFIMLPHNVAREVLAEWLRLRTNAELSKKLLERLVRSAKTGKNESKVDINAAHWLQITVHTLALKPRER